MTTHQITPSKPLGRAGHHILHLSEEKPQVDSMIDANKIRRTRFVERAAFLLLKPNIVVIIFKNKNNFIFFHFFVLFSLALIFYMIKKILITGPESSGKTQLTQDLARHYGCPWVPEFARRYLEHLDRPYQEEDLIRILNGQLRLEGQAMSGDHPYVFCDTGPEVIAIWSEVKYGRVDAYIRQQLNHYRCEAALLCFPDVAWSPDPLREAPDLAARLELFQRYQQLLNQLNYRHTIIRGQGEQRQTTAIDFMRSTA